jgi:hypothetical protein
MNKREKRDYRMEKEIKANEITVDGQEDCKGGGQDLEYFNNPRAMPSEFTKNDAFMKTTAH